MNREYYISAYMCVNPIGHVYDCFMRHDQNMALWKCKGNKVELVRFWELERMTGQKGHHKSFYDVDTVRNFIYQCVRNCGVEPNEVKAIWGIPELENENDNLANDDVISSHSINHLYSSLLMSTDVLMNNDVIGMAVDGGPDNVDDKTAYSKKYYAGCVARKGEVEIFPIYSPGLLWDHMRYQTRLREGTLMALATASTSNYYKSDIELLLIDDYDSMLKAYEKLDLLYDEIKNLTKADEGIRFSGFDDRFTEKENKISMYAKIVQHISLKIMEYNIDSICKKYNLSPEKCVLSMSGGYGLNCPTNSHLCNKYHFKKFMAVPCINDSGIALGIGLRHFYQMIGKGICFEFGNAYKGSNETDLNKLDEYKMFISSINDLNEDVWVSDVTESPIVWFEGCSEIGPRALGHRSIIANPMSSKSKNILNVVKQREWWRPVAPIVLEEHADKWFDMCCDETPFMLHTCQIRDKKRELIPAILHLDGTARVQTIKKDDNSILYDLINAFNRKNGVPMVCNTSLNDKGEPIIDTIDQAMNFALRKKIKVIYINGKRIELKNHAQYTKKTVAKRDWSQLIEVDQEQQKRKEHEVNPYGVEKDVIKYALVFDEISKSMDLQSEKGANRLRKMVGLMKKEVSFDVEDFFTF